MEQQEYVWSDSDVFPSGVGVPQYVNSERDDPVDQFTNDGDNNKDDENDEDYVEDDEDKVPKNLSNPVRRKRGRPPKSKSAPTSDGSKNEEIKCQTCEKTFTAYSSLQRHEITHQANPRRFVCNVCGLKFTQKPSLVTHTKKKHLGQLNFPCSHCVKRFVRNSELQNHIKLVHVEGSHTCGICGRRFKSQYYHKLHEKFHDPSELNALTCKICSKTFLWVRTLKKHMEEQHENPQRFKCPHCPIFLKRHQTLRCHIKRVHLHQLKTPTHKSKYCHKMFTTKSARDMHEARHEFRLPNVWNCHVSVGRSQKVFKCSLCKLDFPTKYLRDQHAKTVHPEPQLVLKKITGKDISLNPDDPTLMELATEEEDGNVDSHWNFCTKCGRAYKDLNTAICHNNFCTQNQNSRSYTVVDENSKTDEDQDMETPDQEILNNCEEENSVQENLQSLDDNNCETTNEKELTSSSVPSFDIAESNLMDVSPSPPDLVEDKFSDSDENEEEQDPEPLVQVQTEPTVNDNEYEIGIGSGNPGNYMDMGMEYDDLDLDLDDDDEADLVDSFSDEDVDDDKDKDVTNKEEFNVPIPSPSLPAPPVSNPGRNRPRSALLSCVTQYEKDHINIDLTAEKPFQCKTCLKFYPSKSGCKSHIKALHEKPSYQCEVCGENFSVKTVFDIHVRVKHTGEKPWKCTECDFSTAYQSRISIHKRKHTGETPYKCKECDYKTRDPASIWQHRKSHRTSNQEEKDRYNMKCTFCNKSFKNYKHFKEHMNAKHTHKNEDGSFKTVQPYTCTLCGNKFGYTASIRLHIKLKHTSQLEAFRKENPNWSNAPGSGILKFCSVDKNLLSNSS